MVGYGMVDFRLSILQVSFRLFTLFLQCQIKHLFCFIKTYFPDCLTTLNACSKQSTWFAFFKLSTL